MSEKGPGPCGPPLDPWRPLPPPSPPPTTILHITTDAGWAKAREAGELVAPSLAEEGFIHCSTFAQVEATANRIFRGSGDAGARAGGRGGSGRS